MSHSGETIILTSTTLSVRSSPAEDFRTFANAQDSIFSFGDFRIQRNRNTRFIDNSVDSQGFSSYATLNTLSATTESFDALRVNAIKENELNVDTKDSSSYAYFGSYYTKVVNAVNNIIENFPYAILAYLGGTANTINNYTSSSYLNTSKFRVPISALTNQGHVIFVSGDSANANVHSIYNNFNEYGVQLSGITGVSGQTHNIIDYTYVSGASGYLTITVDGHLFTGTTTASTIPIYIRPTAAKFGEYKRSLSNLEHQILFDEVFSVLSGDSYTYYNRTMSWPKSIDGFNPDTYGTGYTAYTATLLNECSRIDETKSNWMIRTMIPDNFIDLDSDGQILQSMLALYANELDKIKLYIDQLSSAHRVSYNNIDNIPNRFLHRLSALLGWKHVNIFNDADMFEYMGDEDDDEQTLEDYNLMFWKQILTNINWLYKKKGTRDALSFMFKLIGAPDSLISFNEFVYDIRTTFLSRLNVLSGNTLSTRISTKMNEHGYIDYNASQYVFQEGGLGRGDGNKYIEQWRPEFNPIKRVDNTKITTGETSVYGTENIINTKEVEIELSPAPAIENDAKEWYELNILSAGTSNASVPDALELTSATLAVPSNITAMTISQWLDYVYANNIPVTTRKVLGREYGHGYSYLNLKKVYYTYMYWNSGDQSNRLNFRKLEKFFDLIQKDLSFFIEQIIPATTIFDGAGITYRNTIFNRQKYVYETGINDGSEFRLRVPPDLNPEVHATQVSLVLNNIAGSASTVSTNVDMSQNPSADINAVQTSGSTANNYNVTVNAQHTTAILAMQHTSSRYIYNTFNGNIMSFPPSGVPQIDSAPFATGGTTFHTYHGNGTTVTGSGGGASQGA